MEGLSKPFPEAMLSLHSAKAPRIPKTNDPLEARKAAEEFEAVFIAQMLAPMFQGLETDELFGGGPGEDIYRSVLIEEYGKSIARAGGIGLSDAIQREILRLQEASQQ